MAQSRRPGRRKSEAPHPTDMLVGSRIKLRRSMLGMSQEQLGAALGLTFQQVQKYERAANRIGASRLWQLTQILRVPIQFFFDAADPVWAPGFAETPAEAFDADPLRRQETIELVEAYHAIGDPMVQRRLFELARALAAPADGPAQPPAKRARGRPRRQHRT